MALLTQVGGVSTGGLTGLFKGPLSKLFKKGGAAVFQYPENLGNDPSRMHIVQFNIKNIIPTKFDVKKTLSSVSGSVDTSSVSAAASSAAGAAQTAVVTGAKALQDIQKTLTPKLTDKAMTISLYMPDTLSMNYHAEYSELSLMDATNGMNRIAGAVGSLVEDLAKGGMNKDNMMNSVANAADKYGPEAALRLADKSLGTNVTDLGLKAMGTAVNPQLQLLYKGLGFRRFQMEFLFTPKNKSEADQVTAIINSFVYAAHPTITGTAGMYFTPPSIFEIKFLMAKTGGLESIKNMLQSAANNLIPGLGSLLGGGATGPENDRLFKVGNCVLEDVSVDYAPNGWASFNNGAPVQTRLNLSFMEYEIVDRSRMAAGEVR